MEQNDEQPGMQSSQLSAAELLRTTREGMGISREEVAAELRLHLKLVTALEDNDRSQLPPAAFIGGYLRAYAKLLGLAPEALINSYLNEGVTPADYRSTNRSGESMASSRDPKYRLISIGVAVGLMVLFITWWANERYAFVAALQTGKQMIESSEQQPPMSVASQDVTDNMGQQEVGMLPLNLPTAQEVGATENTPVTSLPLPPQPAPAGASALAAPKAPAVAVATPAPSTAPLVTSNAVQATPSSALMPISEPLPPSVPQATIRLEFQAECWTQVTDAQGRTLTYQLVSPGRRLELHGVAPFKVFLGYAPGVLVYYNGSLFSHSSFQRGDTAKFTLGSAQDNRPLSR